MADIVGWEPLSVLEVAAVWAGAGFPWWIAGGYAMDHAAGRLIRDHGDIDVLVLRRDEAPMRRMLSSWECHASVRARLVLLDPESVLPVGVHDLWYRADAAGPWRFQVMVDEAVGDWFVSRRDARVNRAIAAMGGGADAVRFLAPEIQLYYKAKSVRAKDEVDFAAVLPLLSAAARGWLVDAIGTTYGADHAWIRRLLRAC